MKHVSLFWLLDETMSVMGLRLLRTWFVRPLFVLKRIVNRLAMFMVFMDYLFVRSVLV
ncbi:hypothetical protein ACJBXF_10275 [Streptococcus suis]